MDKIIKNILKKIESEGYEAYIVGGFVRDYLLKKNSYDVDICTNAKPKDLIHLFNVKQNLNNYGSGFYNGKNYRMYRLANILLWRAEIAVEDGDLELARSLVNRIRNRAKYSTPVMCLCTTYENPDANPVVDWTKPAANYRVEPYPEGHPAFSDREEAREAVRMEIRLEFATEGHRFFDLRRWGTADEVLNDFISRDITFRTFMWGAKYDPERNDFWPLPRTAVEEQKGIIKQDSAYLKDLY